MLTGLKKSSLVRKLVFYRPEHNAKELNFEGFEMQKWNKLDRDQKAEEKKLHLFSYHVYSQSYSH